MLRDFADALDKGHIYRAGDIYPRAGKPSQARIAELSGFSNKIGQPLIKEVKPVKPEPEVTNTEVSLEVKPKRGRPKKTQ